MRHLEPPCFQTHPLGASLWKRADSLKTGMETNRKRSQQIGNEGAIRETNGNELFRSGNEIGSETRSLRFHHRICAEESE